MFYQGIDAEFVSLEDIVPERDTEADDILDQSFYDDLAIAMGARLQECGPRVPVVTGGIHSINSSKFFF